MKIITFNMTMAIALAAFFYSFSITAYADPPVASNVPVSDGSEAVNRAKDENHSDLNTAPVEHSLEQDLGVDLEVDGAIKNNQLSSLESDTQAHLEEPEIPSTKDAVPTLKYALPEGSIEASF